jgi:AAA15 family ATPase/GTPase
MLIRFIVDNLYSFGRRTEFNMIPNSRLRTLTEHCYQVNDKLSLLKLTAVYGANAAGKSNLVKSMLLLKMLIAGKYLAGNIETFKFKFNQPEEENDIVIAVEFFVDSTSYLYALKILDGRISEEELYVVNPGSDELIFARTTDEDLSTDIRFSEAFEANEKNMMLKSVLLDEFVKPDQPVLKLLASRETAELHHAKIAYNWFDKDLIVLMPESKPYILAQRIESNEGFRNFIQEVMKSFHVGISKVSVDRFPMDDYFRGNPIGVKIAEDFRKNNANNETATVTIEQSGTANEILLVKEHGDYSVKELHIEHKKGISDESVSFRLAEESDGTVKLLYLLPAIYDVISNEAVYFIDELERSIHPSLIKELIRKFSHDFKSKGQMVFTTHESVLLDQKIFRQDEIWFAEKDANGCTDMYSLNDYKEHKTIDIRKGYLDGRYGAIPFLGNLRDLNWHTDDNPE